MKTQDRRALVDRLRERNPVPKGARWTVNEEALALSLTVLDPFAGFLRRARREGVVPALRVDPVGQDEATESARAFVKRNADLLGIPRHVVPVLAEHARLAEPGDHALARTHWAVRFEAPFASKGYEGFKEVENLADVEVFVDEDGEVTSFVNVSRVHPPLMLDTKPDLAEEDPRAIARLVGRTLFALQSTEDAHDLDVQALHRIPLGELRPDDVTHMQLVIHVATGPQLAWLTYRLAYFVEVAKPAPPNVDVAEEPGATSSSYFFFRYVVDADSGDVLEDTRAPFAAPASP